MLATKDPAPSWIQKDSAIETTQRVTQIAHICKKQSVHAEHRPVLSENQLLPTVPATPANSGASKTLHSVVRFKKGSSTAPI